jgi:hypothetical protein
LWYLELTIDGWRSMNDFVFFWEGQHVLRCTSGSIILNLLNIGFHCLSCQWTGIRLSTNVPFQWNSCLLGCRGWYEPQSGFLLMGIGPAPASHWQTGSPTQS